MGSYTTDYATWQARWTTAVNALSPVGWWRFGESSGTVAVDQLGAHNGSYVNTPTLGGTGAVNGDTDTSAHFTAASSQSVNVPYAAALNPAAISVVVLAYADTTSVQSHLCSTNTTGNVGYRFGVDSFGRIFAVTGTGAGTTNVTASSTVSTGSWHLLAWTNDGTTTKLYIDGVLATGGSGASTYSPATSMATTWAKNSNAGNYWDGSLDEGFIVGRALTATEIASLYTTWQQVAPIFYSSPAAESRARPSWQFALVDVNGNNLSNGEMSMGLARAITFQLCAPSLFTCQIPLTHPDAAVIAAGSSYIKGYRTDASGTKTLRFYGPAWARQVQGGGGGGGVDTLLVTAMDPMAYLSKRFTVATFTAQDRGVILKSVVDTTNTNDGDTGIRTNTANITASSTISPDYSNAKQDLQSLIADYGASLDACEAWLVPIELSSGKIADLYCALRRGSTQNNAVFGYGAGTKANCSAMGRVEDMTNMRNDVLGFTDTMSSNWTNSTSINAYRRLVADISMTGETDPTVVSARTKGDLDRHSTPDQIAEHSLTATMAAPRMFDDFNIGDTVWLDFAKGYLSYTVQQRVYAATIGIDDQGVETFSSMDLRAQ